MPQPDYETVPTREGCVTCRHYFVYRFSFSKHYDAFAFNNHFTSCELCKKWVEEWKKKNESHIEGVNLRGQT